MMFASVFVCLQYLDNSITSPPPKKLHFIKNTKQNAHTEKKVIAFLCKCLHSERWRCQEDTVQSASPESSAAPHQQTSDFLRSTSTKVHRSFSHRFHLKCESELLQINVYIGILFPWQHKVPVDDTVFCHLSSDRTM